MIVVIIAFLVPILLHRFNMRFIPVVVAEIVVGLIIGKSGFHLVSEDPYLELLSLFGFIYLMFLSGVEIDFSRFRPSPGKADVNSYNPLAVSLVIFSGVVILSLLFGFILMWIGVVKEPYLTALIISTVSLGVVLPVLKERRLTETPIGQTILLVTVLLDFVTMIFLAVYISFQSQNLHNVLFIGALFVVAFAVYMIMRRYQGFPVFKVLRTGTVQIGTRAVFALILLFVVLAQSFGVEMILGAFLAGLLVSLAAPNKEFVHKLDSFGYGFLIPIFFVMVGVNMELQKLFTAESIIVIPLLLFFIYISKLVPILVLKKWHTWRETLGSGVLVASTLSLVIAATTVAKEFGFITEQLSGAFILVAVMTCLISPILFAKLFPKEEHRRTRVGIVGANHMTMPVSLDLQKEGYEVCLFTSQPENDHAEGEEIRASRYPMKQVPNLEVGTLEEYGLFQSDVIVLGSTNDKLNIMLAEYAESLGKERIVVRVEDPDLFDFMDKEKFSVISTLYASRALMKGIIEAPSAVRLIVDEGESLHEVLIGNPRYDDESLRKLPFLGDALIMRIYRGESFLIPHGNTQLRLGDRLLVSGQPEQIARMKQELE